MQAFHCDSKKGLLIHAVGQFCEEKDRGSSSRDSDSPQLVDAAGVRPGRKHRHLSGGSLDCNIALDDNTWIREIG